MRSTFLVFAFTGLLCLALAVSYSSVIKSLTEFLFRMKKSFLVLGDKVVEAQDIVVQPAVNPSNSSNNNNNVIAIHHNNSNKILAVSNNKLFRNKTLK